MASVFNYDSPLMRAMSKIADIMILNLLVIVTCIPIFTIGASMSAMHYVLIKLTKNEGSSVAEMYFKSFKDNFVQGTALWFINLAILGFVGFDCYLFFFTANTMPAAVLMAVIAVGILLLMACMYFYPMQARFINPVAKTVKNSFLIMIVNFPKSILMFLLYLVPLGVFILGLTAGWFLIPFVILFGFSAPGYGAAMLYKKVFGRLEPKQEEVASDMDFHIAEDVAAENDAEDATEENMAVEENMAEENVAAEEDVAEENNAEENMAAEDAEIENR